MQKGPQKNIKSILARTQPHGKMQTIVNLEIFHYFLALFSHSAESGPFGVTYFFINPMDEFETLLKKSSLDLKILYLLSIIILWIAVIGTKIQYSISVYFQAFLISGFFKQTTFV